jgi:hypothetical protein
VLGSEVYAGGHFETLLGQSRQRLAALTLQGTPPCLEDTYGGFQGRDTPVSRSSPCSNQQLQVIQWALAVPVYKTFGKVGSLRFATYSS